MDNINISLDTQESVTILETPIFFEKEKGKIKDKNKSKKAKTEPNTPTETVYDYETLKFDINEIINDLINTNTLDISKIPNIDLYVDQLTTFIEDNLFSNKEHQLTKSMVNNYCKNKVIPPAVKKKYTKSHIMLLIIIFNTKSVLNLPDIEKIFKTLYNEDTLDDAMLIDLYNFINNSTQNSNAHVLELTLQNFDNIHNELFANNSKAQLATLATQLAIEANTKKMLAELIIEKYL